MSHNTIETTLPLHGTKNGIISISKLEDPYGQGSGTVASIGVSLAGVATEPDWKVHIPVENLEAVIEALKNLK